MVSSNKAQSELTSLIVSIRENAYALKEEQEDEWQGDDEPIADCVSGK